jgi:hypothetical protein
MQQQPRGSRPSALGRTLGSMDGEPSLDQSARPAVSGGAGTLSKSVVVLAIEPLNMALSTTGRKAYNVMLWLAQRGKRDAEGFYSSPVSEILRGYGSATNASKRVQGYIQQMMGTTIVWRPLAAGDEALVTRSPETMPLEGVDPAAKVTNETRTFPLLAEARIFQRGGEAWVRWFYPPTVQEQLVSPERWAQLELASIATLSTYTAVALYEICARYKDVPGGLTTRKPPEFWSGVLREGGGAKPREWRKFKNELLTPAIADINEKTEITIELREHRDRGLVSQVQFAVARKVKTATQVPAPADVTLVMRGSTLGVREEDIDLLVTKYGAMKVAESLDAIDAQLAENKLIHNRAAYLRRILANRFPEAEGQGGELSASEISITMPATRRRVRENEAEAWKADRIKLVHADFERLDPSEQERWISEAADRLLVSTPSPGVRKRLAERDWQSPLIRMAVLNAFASARFGSRWLDPEAGIEI